MARALMVIEAGLGLALFGLVVGYLPVLYQSYSSRELRISLLDARAGSPPAAVELLARQSRNPDKLEHHLADWEEWMAELLEEQLSYPMLAYFHSQHQNQSWLGALTVMVDASAVVALASGGDLQRQARLTFAMGRHALVDLATVFHSKPSPPSEDRLPPEDFARFRETLRGEDTSLRMDRVSESELAGLRNLYEPYAHALSRHFLIALPPWLPARRSQENWLVTSWEHASDPFAVSDPFRRS